MEGKEFCVGPSLELGPKIWLAANERESAIILLSPSIYVAFNQMLHFRQYNTRWYSRVTTGVDFEDWQLIANTTPLLSECKRSRLFWKFSPQIQTATKTGKSETFLDPFVRPTNGR